MTDIEGITSQVMNDETHASNEGPRAHDAQLPVIASLKDLESPTLVHFISKTAYTVEKQDPNAPGPIHVSFIHPFSQKKEVFSMNKNSRKWRVDRLAKCKQRISRIECRISGITRCKATSTANCAPETFGNCIQSSISDVSRQCL